MTNDVVRVGIIGCGGIANGKHMPALRKVEGVEMVAFCDIIEEKAVKAAAEFGTPDAKVYINAGSVNNYYHKSATCKPAKFSGGTKVTMQYVVDWGYKACPYCNPPTSIGITA